MLPSWIYGVCAMNNDLYININNVAQAKGVTSRSIRLEINKPESKYISREIKVKGGTSYEILFSSLEPELQQKLSASTSPNTPTISEYVYPYGSLYISAA